MNRVADMVKRANNVAIIGHIKTDGDCVCSCLAFKLGMEQLGKHADVFIDSEFYPQLHSLPYIDQINKPAFSKYDLYVCLDTATIDRLGKNKYKIYKNRNISCQIDHHGTNPSYCKVNYINEKSSSTCELIYTFFKLINVRISKDMARLLLTGIMTDSGSFNYSCATKDTLYIASKLLEIYGDTMDKITEPIFASQTLDEYNLAKLAYSKLQFHLDNKLAFLLITKQDFLDTNTTVDNTARLTIIGKNIATVKMMILVSEDITQKDCYYVSIRSKGDCSSRNVASVFGGGGHILASGCKIFDTEANVTKRLLDAATAEINSKGNINDRVL